MPKLNLTQILAVLEADPALAAKLLQPAAILGVMKLYSEYQTDAKDGFISAAEGVQLAADALALLISLGFTLADLQKVVEIVKPLLVGPK